MLDLLDGACVDFGNLLWEGTLFLLQPLSSTLTGFRSCQEYYGDHGDSDTQPEPNEKVTHVKEAITDYKLHHRRRPNLPPQRRRLIRLLPGEVRQLAAEVAVPGRFAVNRPAQVERLNDAAWRQLERLADQAD